MGKLLLVGRLGAKDLRHRPAQAVLLLLAITAATITLTLGLALHGVTGRPYAQTRAATRGPDIVAALPEPRGPGLAPSGPPPSPAQVRMLTRARGVIGYSGPFPVTSAVVRARGVTSFAQVQGRDSAPATVDQPYVTAGTWVRPGGVVLERTYADALGLSVGSRITLNGRLFTVAGFAVTAASPPYPNLCATSCVQGGPDAGLIWVTQAAARSLATHAAPLSYLLNLKLSNPGSAPAFVSAHSMTAPGFHAVPAMLTAWQSVRAADGLLVQVEQQVLAPGSVLLALLAVASVAVLAGGRMAEQRRRVGLLKAVGGGPGLVAVVLLAEHMAIALVAAAIGLLAGWLAAPLLTSPGAALVGAPGAPSLTLAMVGMVAGLAVGIALAATFIPAARAARTSTVSALADAARAPRRAGWLIRMSSLLPVPLLLALRLTARRPRRFVLNAASVAITVAGLVAVLAFHALVDQRQQGGQSGLANPVAVRDSQILMIVTVMLFALAAVNAIFTTWTTALEARRASALARALGLTTSQVSNGLAVAQLLSAVPAAIIGVPAGIGLFAAVNGAGVVTVPPASWLIVAVLGTLLAVGGLARITSMIGASTPPAAILRAETA